MRIRPEEFDDRAAVRAVNEAAFRGSAEADLVEALRDGSEAAIALVAEADDGIVGHIVFSPVALSDAGGIRLVGLGPMAVIPRYQRRGIGSALVREGLDRCVREGYSGVVVLGHPGYYPRFGFVPASRYGISSEYDVPEEVFMVLELRAGSLARHSGRVTYSEAFRSV